MKETFKVIGKIFNLLAKIVGYLLLIALIFGVLFWHVWRPLKIAKYEPKTPEHLQQKEAYLAAIPKSTNYRPNIVLINFDDLGYGDLSCYGNQLIQTPAIDSLAANGVKMTAFYSCSPVCTPSRAGLLTGRFPIRAHAANHVYFPENHPVTAFRKFRNQANELPKDEITIAEILRASGYQTSMVGKWHLGDRAGHLPNDFGFENYYGVHYSNDMLPLHIYRNKDIEIADKTELADGEGNFITGKLSYIDPETPLKTKGVDQTNLTENYTKEAIQFIEKSKGHPFFLYFAHSFPHVPHFASSKHAGQSEGGLYGDVIEDLDRSVASIIQTLEQQNLLDNTLVIITSDNGGDFNGSSGNLRGRKFETFEGGQRVPLIVYWKGKLPKGIVTDQIAMNTDLMPTLLSIAKIPLPSDRKIDGRNIWSVWTEKAESPHKVLYYFSPNNGMPKGARNKQFKYHTAGEKFNSIYGGLAAAQLQKPQLTNILLDNEAHNLILKYPTITEELKNSIEQIQEDFKKNQRGWVKE